jgi:hypothetical protein
LVVSGVLTADAEVAALYAMAGDAGALETLETLAIRRNGHWGFGLPEEFDAFSDGSVNPADTIYSYTTALAGLAFLMCGKRFQALSCARTLRDISCGGEFVWYSDQAVDQQPGYEVPNVTGLAVSLFSRLGQNCRRYVDWLLHWQGRDLDEDDPDYHPHNWRYRLGKSQPTDLFHEVLIARGLLDAGESEAADRSLRGMLTTHFNGYSPRPRHLSTPRDRWGPFAMYALLGRGLIESPWRVSREGRDTEVACAWETLALALAP